MSSKKIYTTVGLDAGVFECLKFEAAQTRRSLGFIVEQLLREHYRMLGAGSKEIQDAN